MCFIREFKSKSKSSSATSEYKSTARKVSSPSPLCEKSQVWMFSPAKVSFFKFFSVTKLYVVFSLSFTASFLVWIYKTM